MRVGKFDVGAGHPTYIVAELSANHGGSLDVALATVRAMKDSGADAVKLQTYTPDTLTLNVHSGDFVLNTGSIWDGKTYYDLYKDAMTPWEWHKPIKELANELGMGFFSTPFDNSAVDFLEELGVDAYKIASFEINDVNLIEYAARKGKPMIISTGIGTKDEITDAVDVCKKVGNNEVMLLKCTSKYPADYEEANLSLMPKLRSDYGVQVGLSDHTYGWFIPLMSVTLGACMVEKHFILNREVGGADAKFSMLPDEFAEMVKQIRLAETSLGNGSYEILESVQPSRAFMRSLYISSDVKAGETLTADNVKSVRPGFGLAPKHYKSVLGRKAKHAMKLGDRLSLSDLE